MTEVNVKGSIDLNVNRGKRVSNNQRTHFKKDECKPRVKTDEEYIAQLNAAMQKAGGRYVKFDNVDHTEGLMIAGVQSNDGKYMFAIVDRDRHIQYVGNNEHFSVIRGVPASLYVLDYLYQHESANLHSIAVNTFDVDNMKVITKLYINVQKKTTKTNNKRAKNTKKNTNKK